MRGACAVSDVVRHVLHRSISVDSCPRVGLDRQLLAAGRAHAEFIHFLRRGCCFVSIYSFGRRSICFSIWLSRVDSLEIEGRDHCVRPAVNGVFGVVDVKVGDVCMRGACQGAVTA